MTFALRSIKTVLACFGLLALTVPAFAQAQPITAQSRPGAVYVATNAVDGNAVMAFAREPDGSLGSNPEIFPTGGLGTGTGLGNQGGVVLSTNRRLLFVVNAGSNDISVFRVVPKGLRLLSVTDSGGERPVSLTQHRDLLYVLNAGGSGNGKDSIAGFRIDPAGKLELIPDSVQPLSGASTAPAQIGFAARGAVLLVTEKATNKVTTYIVDQSGAAGAPLPQDSIGETPFGFATGRRNVVLISEAFGGAPGASAVTSYAVGQDGLLEVLTPSIPLTQTAACWVAVRKGGRFAYTTNTGDSTISGLAIDRQGGLTLLDPDGVTGTTGAAPIDMGFSRDGRYLYTLNAADGSLSVFRHDNQDGGLKPLQTVPGLPGGANGLAAR